MHFSGLPLDGVVHLFTVAVKFRLLLLRSKYRRHAENHYNDAHLYRLPCNALLGQKMRKVYLQSDGRMDGRTFFYNQLAMANKLRCSDHRNMFDALFLVYYWCICGEWKVSEVSGRQSILIG